MLKKYDDKLPQYITVVILTLLLLGRKYYSTLLPFQGQFNVIKITTVS